MPHEYDCSAAVDPYMPHPYVKITHPELLKISQNTFIDNTQETYEIYPYRDTQKNKVGFVIENADGDTIGVEVKASQTAFKF